VVEDHVHLREHSDVVEHERRHDEGLVLLVHHQPVSSGVSHAQAEAGEHKRVFHAHTCVHDIIGRLVTLVSVGW